MPKARPDEPIEDHGAAVLTALRRFLASKSVGGYDEEGTEVYLRLLGTIGDFARQSRQIPGTVAAALIELCEDGRKGL